MVDQAAIASGSELRMSDAAGTTFTAIGECLKIGDFVFDAPLVDATRLNALVKEYVAGLPDTPGLDIEIRLKMDDPMQNNTSGVQFVFENGQQRNYQVKLNKQGLGIQFAAVPTGHGIMGLAPGELMKRSFKLKVTGNFTILALT